MSSLNGFAKLTSNESIIFDVIECIIGVMGSVTNMAVLLAIYKERRLRTIKNCFVGSLAASDVFVGMVVPPMVVLSSLHLKIDFSACVMINSLVVLSTNISVLNLLSVAFDRFFAIRKPFTYIRWMSIRRALFIVAATWLVATVIGLAPVLGWNRGEDGYSICSFSAVITLDYLVYAIFFTFTLPPFIAMTSIYSYIFRVVRRTKRMTAQLMTSVGQKNAIKKSIKRQSRGDKSIIMVIVLFIVCWMPLHITNAILFFSDLHVPREFYQMCNILSRFNSLVNPFLFAFGYSGFKYTIKKILFNRCIDIREEPDPMPGGISKRRVTKAIRKKTTSVLSVSSEESRNVPKQTATADIMNHGKDHQKYGYHENYLHKTTRSTTAMGID
ncbi:hypothetical protein ACOMHN_040871 [Nucella lapillus]